MSPSQPWVVLLLLALPMAPAPVLVLVAVTMIPGPAPAPALDRGQSLDAPAPVDAPIPVTANMKRAEMVSPRSLVLEPSSPQARLSTIVCAPSPAPGVNVPALPVQTASYPRDGETVAHTAEAAVWTTIIHKI